MDPLDLLSMWDSLWDLLWDSSGIHETCDDGNNGNSATGDNKDDVGDGNSMMDDDIDDDCDGTNHLQMQVAFPDM